MTEFDSAAISTAIAREAFSDVLAWAGCSGTWQFSRSGRLVHIPSDRVLVATAEALVLLMPQIAESGGMNLSLQASFDWGLMWRPQVSEGLGGARAIRFRFGGWDEASSDLMTFNNFSTVIGGSGWDAVVEEWQKRCG